MRIGIDATTARLRAVVADADSVMWATEHLDPPSIAAGCAAVVDAVDGDLLAQVTHVTVALSAQIDDLDLEHVGLVRIAPRSADALAPLRTWPGNLAARLTGRVLVIPGGASFLGTDPVHPAPDHVASAVEQLMQAGATRIVIAAAGGLAIPEIERRAARIARRSAPDLDVTVAHLMGGMGLRERENSAILEAALIPWAGRISRELSHAMPGLTVCIARGSGSRVICDYFAANPLGSVEGRQRCALDGAVALTESTDLLVALTEGDTVTLLNVSGGRLARPDIAEIWGVRHNHQPVGAAVLERSADWRGVIAAARRLRPLHDLALVGDVDDLDDPPADTRRTPHAAYAVAIGAARTEFAVETDRIVTADPAELTAVLDALTEEITSLAITAGTDPTGSLSITTEAVPISFVPEGSRFVRLRARERRVPR